MRKRDERAGVFRVEKGESIYLGAPYYNWGRFYAEIVHSVLTGTINLQESVENRKARNYWFGLDTGVVDIRTRKLPYSTDKLLGFMKKGIIDGTFTPFSGRIVARDGRVIQEEGSGADRRKKDTPEIMTPAKLISMDWLNENIDGEF